MATTGKAALRERLLAARRRVADDVRAAEARMLREQLEFMVTSGSTVCAYVPVGAEPGSVEMLDMLLRRAGRVLLPPPPTTPRCRCAGANTGPAPRAGAAVAARIGAGRRGGDRDPRARLVALVRDAELLDELPAEPHDVPMTHALTPQRGWVTLGAR